VAPNSAEGANRKNVVFFAAIFGIPILIYHLKEKREEREGEKNHMMPYVTFIITPGKIIITSFKNRFIFSLNEVKKVHLYFGGIIIEAAKESTGWKAECTAEFEESIRFYEYAESLGIPSERHTAVTEGRELERERMPSI
jgi:hypothetical protein